MELKSTFVILSLPMIHTDNLVMTGRRVFTLLSLSNSPSIIHIKASNQEKKFKKKQPHHHYDNNHNHNPPNHHLILQHLPLSRTPKCPLICCLLPFDVANTAGSTIPEKTVTIVTVVPNLLVGIAPSSAPVPCPLALAVPPPKEDSCKAMGVRKTRAKEGAWTLMGQIPFEQDMDCMDSVPCGIPLDS